MGTSTTGPCTIYFLILALLDMSHRRVQVDPILNCYLHVSLISVIVIVVVIAIVSRYAVKNKKISIVL